MTMSTHRDDVASWSVGDLTVRRIDEVELGSPAGLWLLPDATPELVASTPWLQPHFATGEGILRLASHSFALDVGGLRILVDTGIGNGKTRANPAWHQLDTGYLERLAAAGFAPETVDLVIITHLHTDHVGWNTRADGDSWLPTFPRARYLTSRTEWDYWASVDMDEPRRQMFRDSVHPVRDSGQFDLVDVPDEGVEAAPGVRLLPAPGHTPGQIVVELDSAGHKALITGDSFHHPVQLAHPHLSSCVDIDPQQAVSTRRRLLASLADSDTLVFGTHFAPPTAGLVRGVPGGYRLDPVPARER
jgi:glyoxylase-like metal-dependent hydrolase (beta-lactamase superfamily II)